MASALSAARMAALMGQTSGESDACQGVGPLWLASLCPLTPPPLQKPASAETPLPQPLPAAIPPLRHKNRGCGVNPITGMTCWDADPLWVSSSAEYHC